MIGARFRKAARRAAACALLLALPFLAGGCAEAPGRLLVMRANSLAARGMHAQAIALYLEARGHEGAAPYAEFGLGLTFLALGEEEAALGRFAEAGRLLDALPEGLHGELRYRNHYNSGIVLFSKGDFAGAADSFREALRASSGRLEAMRNLELSLMSAERESSGGAGEGGGGEPSEAMALAFEHIRQQGVEQWRNRAWPEDERAPGDDR